MKSIKICLFAATVLFSVMNLKAQTVDEIIAKHIEAIGGKEKINKVKSMYIESTMQIMGNEAPAKIYIINGKGYRSEIDFSGQTIVQTYTDKEGWMINPMTGASTASPLSEEQYIAGKDQIFIGGALHDYAAKGKKVELLGKEGDAYKIKVTSGKTESTYLIDPNTYYITKMISKANMQGQEVDMTVNFSNYKKTEMGYVLPYDTEMDFGGFAMSSNVKKVEINKEIDPKLFEMPK